MVLKAVRWLVPKASVLHRICERSQIRIGYVHAISRRREDDRSALDRDLAACHDLSRSLGAIPVFMECRHSELVPGLHVGALDLAVGGVVDRSCAQITCITVRHPGIQPGDTCRRVPFRNMWCIRRGDLVWASLLCCFVQKRRLGPASFAKPAKRGILSAK